MRYFFLQKLKAMCWLSAHISKKKIPRIVQTDCLTGYKKPVLVLRNSLNEVIALQNSKGFTSKTIVKFILNHTALFSETLHKMFLYMQYLTVEETCKTHSLKESQEIPDSSLLSVAK